MAIDSLKNDRFLECESCGSSFSCGAGSSDCWCFEVDLESADTGRIRENFADCLCPECLGAIRGKENETVSFLKKPELF